MSTMPVSVQKDPVAHDEATQKAQSVRLRRFAMAVATYVVVTFATFLTTRLGLGQMSAPQWATFIGIGLAGNLIFFALFYAGVNLRFSDPSLTREQIVYSAAWGLVPIYALPEARPVVLMFYVPAFTFGMLRLTRGQFLWVTACVMCLYASLLVVEYLQARRGFQIQYELFLFALFGILLTWLAFFGGFVSDMRRRLRLRNLEIEEAHGKIEAEMYERQRAQAAKDQLIVDLEHALSEVKTLTGLLPICSSCKRIRDDKGYWNQLESYIRDHSEAEFTHSICPECQAKLYPDLFR